MSKLYEELVRAFNINNYHSRIMRTNFTVQDLDGRDYITMTFADNMHPEQCVSYLNNLRERIIKEFYPNENEAKKSFNLDYFPFKRVDSGALSKDRRDPHNRWQFKVPVAPSILFNLKSHLAHSIAKNIRADMDVATWTETYKDKKYIMCIHFQSKKPATEFALRFLAKMEEYDNSPSDPVKVKGNDVYIRDIFNDIDLVKSSTEDTTCKIGFGLEFDSSELSWTTEFKEMFTQFITCSTGIKINKHENAGYEGTTEYSIIIPTVKSESEKNRHHVKGKYRQLAKNNSGEERYLDMNEVNAINHAFGFNILNSIIECVQRDNLSVGSPELQRNGVYGIDLANKDISNCVINTVLENSLVTQVGRDKYELVVESSPQLIELYIDNIKLGNIRRPSTPEIQSTSWQQKAGGVTNIRSDVKRPPPVPPKPTAKEADSTTSKPLYDILQEKVIEVLQSRFELKVCNINPLVKEVIIRLVQMFNLPKIYDLKYVLPQINREVLNEVINQVPLKLYFTGNLSDLAKDRELKPASTLKESLDFIAQSMLSNYSPEVRKKLAGVTCKSDSYSLSGLIEHLNKTILLKETQVEAMPKQALQQDNVAVRIRPQSLVVPEQHHPGGERMSDNTGQLSPASRPISIKSTGQRLSPIKSLGSSSKTTDSGVGSSRLSSSLKTSGSSIGSCAQPSIDQTAETQRDLFSPISNTSTIIADKSPKPLLRKGESKDSHESTSNSEKTVTGQQTSAQPPLKNVAYRDASRMSQQPSTSQQLPPRTNLASTTVANALQEQTQKKDKGGCAIM